MAKVGGGTGTGECSQAERSQADERLEEERGREELRMTPGGGPVIHTCAVQKARPMVGFYFHEIY